MRRMRRWMIGMVGAVAAAAVLGCASRAEWSLQEPPTVAPEWADISVDPRERDPSLYWDAVRQSSFYLLEQSLDLPRQFRKLTGRMHEAVNADVFGEIPNSSWFTHRHGRTRLGRDELQRGPNRIAGPDTAGVWTITRAKTEGVTPGFFIKDAAGETFILKFDPAAHPELATGAEMVSTKLFHAFGYYVPENYLVTFDPARLVIRDGLKVRDAKGRQYPFTREELERVLATVARRPDGTIRAVASRLLPGTPIGPFSYQGVRRDDPNDRVPHEHRRELRGLKIFAQLTNHFDTKDHNSLDVVVEEDGRRFVRHYLIDFGSTLGSDGDEPKSAYKGYAYVLDLEQALVSLVTLGLRRWTWEEADPRGIPAAVGYFESDLFDPPGWKPLHANPAFDNMTHADAFWACRILSQFTEDDLRACVETAAYSDSAATEYLVKHLWARRNKILAYYYAKTSPLDAFTLDDTGESVTLRFVDRVIADGVGDGGALEYRWSLDRVAGSIGSQEGVASAPVVALDGAARSRLAAVAANSGSDRERVFRLDITPRRAGAKACGVYLYLDPAQSRFRIVGLDRPS